MDEQVETFADATVKMPAGAKTEGTKADAGGTDVKISTFDDGDWIDPKNPDALPMKKPKDKSMDKDYIDPEDKSIVKALPKNEGKKEAVKNEDGTVGKDGKKGPKAEEGEKAAEDTANPEAKEGSKEGVEKGATDEGPKNRGKGIKAKDGDKELELSPETEFRQKVDGKYETFKLRDLLNRKAGEVSIEKRFQELSQEKKTYLKEKEQYTAEKAQVQDILRQVSTLLDDKEANPLDVVQFLVDVSGRDPIAYNEKMKEYLQREFETLDGMTEDERQLYWKDKEIQFLRHRHKSSLERAQQQKQYQEAATAVDKKREAAGVSQEQFVKAYEDLLSKGVEEKNLTADVVIERAVMQPFVDRAQKLVTPLEEDLSSEEFDALVTETAGLLKQFPQFSGLEALKFAAKKLNFEVEEVSSTSSIEKKIETLPDSKHSSTRPQKAYRGKVLKADEDEVELFGDDF